MRPRRLAFCVETWNSQENHYAWMWTRKRFLQALRQPCDDFLYIVHVNRGKTQGDWALGGPLIGDPRAELQEIEGLNAEIVVLEGDAVSSLLSFSEQKNIDIMILGTKAHGRMRRTVTRGTTVNIGQKASCACVIISPRITAGEQIRIQAARETMHAVPFLQFSRKVAIVLNAGPFDANLVHYAAKNVLLPGDKVTVVRCFTKNILNRQNREELEIEKGSAREIGRSKLRGSDVAMSVEILNGGLRVFCNTIEAKGIDLVVFMRTEEKRMLRPIQTGPAFLQSFPCRFPCPCMVVPMSCLERFSESSSSLNEIPARMAQTHRPSSLSAHMFRIAKRGRPGQMSNRMNRRQQSRSMDSEEYLTDDARVMEAIAGERIELDGIEELDLESNVSSSRDRTQGSFDETIQSPFSRKGSLPISVESSCPTPVPLSLERRLSGSNLINILQQQLEERDAEIEQLKMQISILQRQPRGEVKINS